MKIASLGPMALGIVRWEWNTPRLSVVAKITYRLGEGRAELSAEPEPLSLDCGDPTALEYASDFVPVKARGDVLLVGRAWSSEPARVIPVRLGVDDLDKLCFAVAPGPWQAIPLLPTFLRAAPEHGAPVSVGPRSVGVPLPAPGAPSRLRLGSNFDVGAFNAAPRDQQTGWIRPDAVLRFEGLLMGAGGRPLTLAGYRPRVFCVSGDSYDGPPPEELSMVCDTLWIAADRHLCTLTFRGSLAFAGAEEEPRFLVAVLSPPGDNQSFGGLREKLDAAVISRAMEARDLVPSVSPSQRDLAYRPPPSAAVSADDERQVTLQIRNPADYTVPLPAEVMKAGPTLPFLAPLPGQLDTPRTAVSASMTLPLIDNPVAAAPLPFRSAAAKEPDLDLDAYIALRVDIEGGSDLETACQRHGVSPAEWPAIHRRWRQRAVADKSLGDLLRSKLLEARKA